MKPEMMSVEKVKSNEQNPHADGAGAVARRTAALELARAARKAGISVVKTEIILKDALKQVDPSRSTAVAERLAQMPKHCRGVYLRAVGGKSLRAAVNAFCLECVTWNRAEVARCTALACPLYACRPFKEV